MSKKSKSKSRSKKKRVGPEPTPRTSSRGRKPAEGSGSLGRSGGSGRSGSSGSSGRQRVRYSRLPAIFVATILGVFTVVLLLTYRDAPEMVLQAYSRRLRLYLGMAAAASGLTALALVAGGSRADRAMGRLIDRLRDDATAALDRGRSALRATPPTMLVSLGIVTLVGIWIRIRYMGQPMRYDEAYTYYFYGRYPLAVSLSAYDSPNNHPLNTLLLHLSTALFGNSEWSVRLPAFLFGASLTPAVYLTARVLAGGGASLLAAAATAGWPVLVEYSVNARGYSAIAFFFVTSLAAARLLLEDDRLLYRIALVGSSVGILYATPAGIYAAATCWGWLLASTAWRGRESRGPTAAGVVGIGLVVGAITAALYAFPLIVGGFGAVLQRSDIRPLGLGDYLGAAPRSLVEIGRFCFRSIPMAAAAAVAAAAVVGIVWAFKSKGLQRGIVEAPALGLLPALGVTVVQRQWPYTRAWIFIVPLVLITSAKGLAAADEFISGRLARPSPRTTAAAASLASVAVAASLALSLISSGAVEKSTDTGYAPDAREAAFFLKERLDPGDAMLARVPADGPLKYYFIREGMGIEYFESRRPTRVIAFVDEGSESVESVLEFFGVRPAEGDSPVKIWEGERAALYRLDRFTSG